MGEAGKQENVTTYEEMAEVVARLGIVPLAPLIPEHPSVNGLTLAENWHTDTELDPWRWRVRFPGEGLAAMENSSRKSRARIPRVASGLLGSVRASAVSGRAVSERPGHERSADSAGDYPGE